MLKRFLKSPAAAAAGAFLVRAYIRLVAITGRRTVSGLEHLEEALASGQGVIIAFWHSRLMMAPVMRAQIDRDVYMLISANRDGEIIAKSVEPFGLKFIRGSTRNPRKPEKNKSGASAILQMQAALKDGEVVGVTPDGPRGPAEIAQTGIVKLAKTTGALILPGGIGASPATRLNTWDRFMLAWPFARLAFVAGPPIRLNDDFADAALESDRLTVENALLEVTRKADAAAKGQAH